MNFFSLPWCISFTILHHTLYFLCLFLVWDWKGSQPFFFVVCLIIAWSNKLLYLRKVIFTSLQYTLRRQCMCSSMSNPCTHTCDHMLDTVLFTTDHKHLHIWSCTTLSALFIYFFDEEIMHKNKKIRTFILKIILNQSL